jgi:putative redox protein
MEVRTMQLTVLPQGGDCFAIYVRDHRLVVDQPVSEGGTDTGPTPTEIFVAGLVSCIAFYGRRYLVRHGLSEQGFGVEASFRMAADPPRVGSIDIRLRLPDGFPAERRAALLAVVGHCTVHNSLTDPPRVTIGLAAESAAA